MDNKPSSPGATTETPQPNTPSRLPVAVVCAFFVLAPLLYLIIRSSSNAHLVHASQPAPAAQAAPLNLPDLEALAKASPTPDNRVNLATAYINQNTPARAIPVLLSVVAEDKTNAIAWNDLCVANTLQHAYDVAIDACNHALTLAPNLQLAKNNLKWATDEKAKAIAALSTDEKTAPAFRNAAFYLNEGMDQLHAGNYDQAIKAWRRTLDLDPKNALAANNIGTALMLKKQTNEAISWFNKALAFDPNLQLAKNNLAWAHGEQSKAAK